MERTLFQPIIDKHLAVLFEEQIEIAEAELELSTEKPTKAIRAALQQLSDMWDACEEQIAVLEGRKKPKEEVDWSRPARSKGKQGGVHEITRDWKADVVGTLLVDEELEVDHAMEKYEELSAPRPRPDYRRQEKVRAWLDEHRPEFTEAI